MKRLCLAVGILWALQIPAGIGAIKVQLATVDMQRATELARWPHTDAERAQFHKRYTFVVNGPVVEYFSVENIEIITPFRRLELIAEEHAKLNDLFARGGMRDAEDALRPWRDRVSIVAHLRFDLTKLIPDVPDADIALEGSRNVLPIAVNPSGIYTRSGDLTYLVGGVVEAVFDIRDFGQTEQPVVVRWSGKEIARVAVDFAALE